MALPEKVVTLERIKNRKENGKELYQSYIRTRPLVLRHQK